jgi:hypothetical protein
MEEKESRKERHSSARLRAKAEPLRGIERLKALYLLKTPSRDHLKPFILCKLNDDCRTCKFRETCKTNAIAYINGVEMPYEPYWFRKAIANAIDKHSK